MTRLQLAIRAYPGGPLIADHSHMARNLRISTGEHGCKAATWNVPLSLREAFRFYDQPGQLHAEVNIGGGCVWAGRLEDPTISDAGLDCTALGYWRALSDMPYTALWSDTRVGEWRPVLTTELGDHTPERYEIDTNNRLYISPRKNETFTHVASAGGLTDETPSGSSRQIVAVSFDYAVFAPAGWEAWGVRRDRAYTGATIIWALGGNGAVQTGTQTLSMSGVDRLEFLLLWAGGGSTTPAVDTGTYYLRITNLRVKTTTSAAVYADEIARDLIADVVAVNPTQLSSTTGLVQSPALDLKDELYEDEYPADILSRLVKLGDSSIPPRQWEAVVWEDRMLRLQPRGHDARTWYVDAASLQLQSTRDTLRNSAYTVYQDASNRTVRGSVSTDAASVARYGLTRRAKVDARTTSSAQANVHRDAYLADHSTIMPRASVTFDALYDASGARYPLWQARAGDTLVLRNLPPNLSVDIDKIRSFRIYETDYDVDADRLAVTPEAPLPTLDRLLARREEGF